MAKKVLKFGGTSVGTIERILHVAKIIKKEYDAGNEVIAVVSAMSGKTNELLKQSKIISEDFDKREDIHAIILWINSPGGAVVPSQEIYYKVDDISNNSDASVIAVPVIPESFGYNLN